MDAYWAKDIQELFRLERRDSFQRFTRLVMAQSGSIFDAAQLPLRGKPGQPSQTTSAFLRQRSSRMSFAPSALVSPLR